MSWYYHIHQYVLSKFTNFILEAIVSIGGSGSGGRDGDYHHHTDVVNTQQWMVKVVMVVIQVGVVIVLIKVVALSTLMWDGHDGHIIKVVMVAVNACCRPGGHVINAGGGSSRGWWRRLHCQCWWWDGSDGQIIKIVIIMKMKVVAIIAIWWSTPGVVAVEDGLSENEELSKNSEVCIIYHFTTPKVTTITMCQCTTNASNDTTTTTTATSTDSCNDHDPTTTSHKTMVTAAFTSPTTTTTMMMATSNDIHHHHQHNNGHYGQHQPPPLPALLTINVTMIATTTICIVDHQHDNNGHYGH
ncbi:hypothetical protein J3A83DRAFT_4189319 [Scleroderma citrinum]